MRQEGSARHEISKVKNKMKMPREQEAAFVELLYYLDTRSLLCG